MGTENVKNMDFFFNPSSVAVVGASGVPGKLSGIILASLLKSRFKGAVYPVNPKYTEVLGIACYPSIKAIGKEIDIAIFALPAALTPAAVKAAAGLAAGAIIVSGGFGEADGWEYESEIKTIAADSGMRVIGPNCMGIYDTLTRLDTFFIADERIKRPKRGGLSMVSQSGSFAITAMDELAADGLGVARIISYGNKADVNESDCLDFLAEDDATKAVALYIESVDDGRRFVEAAGRCSAQKPVMAVKVGKGAAGSSAARSHTGAIAGRPEIYSAAFKKAGVVELHGYEDFICGCKAYGIRNEPLECRGSRVMIITDGGGMGVGIADACVQAGLEVAAPSADVVERLSAIFPAYFSMGNPIDLTGSVTDEWYARSLEAAMSGDNYDIAIVAALWGPPNLTDDLAKLLAWKARESGKPVIICSPGGAYSRKKAKLFMKEGLPVFTTPEAAVRAAAVLARGAAGRRRAI
ncbi:MAG: CoA-binding protein [Deltaproteobacteria bacterium]|nr:CoA-binding protein [Deltaproteobacteria bacterium]